VPPLFGVKYPPTMSLDMMMHPLHPGIECVGGIGVVCDRSTFFPLFFPLSYPKNYRPLFFNIDIPTSILIPLIFNFSHWLFC